MLVQDVHVDVGRGAEHVVRLVLAADRVESASDEVRPLVSLRRWRWSSVTLNVAPKFTRVCRAVGRFVYEVIGQTSRS